MVEGFDFRYRKHKPTLVLLFIWLAMASQLGCDEVGESAAPEIGARQFDVNMTSYITSALRTALDPSGSFRFPEPEAPPGGPPILTSLQAAELAVAYARQFAPYIRSSLEKDHGGPIDFESLEVDGQTLFVESAYEPLPEGTYMPFQKAAGPYYLFTLQEGGQPTLSVAVSAYATDLRIENGRVLLPKISGNEFRMNGINPTTGLGVMTTPELAVQRASQTIGALVNSLPVLRSRGMYWSPQLAYWEVELDRSMPVRVEGRGTSTNRAYITHDGQLETVRPNWNHAAALPIPTVRANGLDWSENRTIQLQHRW